MATCGGTPSRGQAGSVHTWIREEARLQHLVRGGLNARYEMPGREGRLLDLRKVVAGVLVQHEAPDRPQRVVAMGPHLRDVKRVILVRRRVLIGHHLQTGTHACTNGNCGVSLGTTWHATAIHHNPPTHLDKQPPRRLASRLDRLIQVPRRVVGVCRGRRGRLVSRHACHADLWLPMQLHPVPHAGGVHPPERVRRVPVHVPAGVACTPAGSERDDASGHDRARAGCALAAAAVRPPAANEPARARVKAYQPDAAAAPVPMVVPGASLTGTSLALQRSTHRYVAGVPRSEKRMST